MSVPNFTILDSVHGRFIVNRHDALQPAALLRTGRTHIEGEIANILTVARLLEPDSVAVDAGANIGFTAVPLARALRDKRGVVHAFEPQRMLAYALAGTAALNDLDNLQIHQHALGAANERQAMTVPDYAAAQDFGQIGLVSPPGERTEHIDIVTIDGLALPRLDFLKIDVEGMELEVLEGGRATVAANAPWCWIEYWKSDAEAIKRHFAGQDYAFYRASEHNMLCVPARRAAGIPLSISAPPM